MTGPSQITRREFLAAAGALVVTVSAAQNAPRGRLPRSAAANPDLDTWLSIARDGRVTVFSGKCELGQGIETSLAQIVADELMINIERIRMAPVDTAHSPNEGRTVGSNSIIDSGGALRLAGAEAREILAANASRLLGVPRTELTISDGRITAAGSTQSVSYWELLADGRFSARLGETAVGETRPPNRYVGSPQPRLDLPAKFFGEPAYVHDRVLPGMLHARVVRGAAAPNRLVSVDESAARSMPGVVAVIRNGNFLAVVAEREEQAVAAAAALRAAARWQPPDRYPDREALPAVLRGLPTMDSIVDERRADSGSPVRRVEAEYSRPFIAHASLGPSAALAQWEGSMLTVVSHAQGMYPLRDAIAAVLDLPVERVRCVHAHGSGCYGHNGADDVACDAALIAMAVEGRPIRLLWSREDEFRQEPYGSAMCLQIAAGLDAASRIVDWRYDLWSCSHSTRPAGGAAAGGLLAAREKERPLPLPRVSDPVQPTGGADRNAIPLYTIPNQRIVEHLVLEPPLRNSALRSLGAHGNVFAIESFLDELALAARVDPLEFRLTHLDDRRARAVIESVRDLAARNARTETADRAWLGGRGLGFARYKNSSTYLAVVADVSVDTNTGVIAVRHVFAAVDAGRVVNPDGLRNQIEGGIVQSTSWALKEQVRFSTTSIDSVDWVSYPVLRFSEVPRIDIEVLVRPESPSLGAGEAAQGPTAAAIANAVAAATGARLRHLPLTPERVLAALAA